MGYGDKIQETFPNVNWTGSSDIHRSHFMERVLPVPFEKKNETMTLVVHGHLAEQMWDMYQEMFPDSEWLLSPDEFKKLTLLDVYRHLNGEGDSFTEKKLVNPSTGNQFHRLVIHGDLIGGIRYWAHGAYDYRTAIGWRFRWERLAEDEDTVRIKTRNKVEVAVEEWEKIAAKLAIPEPTEAQIADAVDKIRVAEDD
jgi:hypothetical protein